MDMETVPAIGTYVLSESHGPGLVVSIHEYGHDVVLGVRFGVAGVMYVSPEDVDVYAGPVPAPGQTWAHPDGHAPVTVEEFDGLIADCGGAGRFILIGTGWGPLPDSDSGSR